MLLATTETELRAMAKPAHMGSIKYPVMGYKAPAAMGKANRLYKKAQARF